MSTNNLNTEDTFLTRREVAEKLRVSYPTLKAWRKKGILTACKLGGTVRYSQNQIDKDLKGNLKNGKPNPDSIKC